MPPSDKWVRPVEVRALEPYRIWLRYDDGVEGELDLSYLAGDGVFAAWEDHSFSGPLGPPKPPATSSCVIPGGSPTPEHFCETAPASSPATSMGSSVARASRFSRHPSGRRSRTRSPNAGSALCDPRQSRSTRQGRCVTPAPAATDEQHAHTVHRTRLRGGSAGAAAQRRRCSGQWQRAVGADRLRPTAPAPSLPVRPSQCRRPGPSRSGRRAG